MLQLQSLVWRKEIDLHITEPRLFNHFLKPWEVVYYLLPVAKVDISHCLKHCIFYECRYCQSLITIWCRVCVTFHFIHIAFLLSKFFVFCQCLCLFHVISFCNISPIILCNVLLPIFFFLCTFDSHTCFTGFVSLIGCKCLFSISLIFRCNTSIFSMASFLALYQMLLSCL